MSNQCQECLQPLSPDKKGKYCSVACSTVSGTERLKFYGQSRNKTKYNNYAENLKHCAHCGISLNFEQRNNKFCSKSCSAHHNNSNRQPSSNSNAKRRSTLIARHMQLYSQNPKQCVNCHRAIDYDSRKQEFCSKLCHQEHVQKNSTSQDITTKFVRCVCARTGEVFYSPTWRKYSNQAIYNELKLYRHACQFTFGIGDNFPNANLLQTYGWYHPVSNPGGVSRDHKFSVADGFRLGIDPSIMRHPANCELMIHKSNQHKLKKSSIDYSMLLEMIKLWPFE